MNRKLVITGNGFDLAHNLPTSYPDFIKDLIKNILEGTEEDYDLIDIPSDIKTFKQLATSKDKSIKYHNNLLKSIIQNFQGKNWCDIESTYFDNLKHLEDASVLNDDLEQIKQLLCKYLAKVTSHSNHIINYGRIFQALDSNYHILNFNYTNTYSLYDVQEKNVTNIHGQITNPRSIIFGYAADDDETSQLLDKGENNLLTNIKKCKYKTADTYDTFLTTLGSGRWDVLLFGHSCGTSDRLILQDIFENPNVEKIVLFYHEDETDFFNKQVNIQRISKKRSTFDKIVNYPESHLMPQHTDKPKLIEQLLQRQVQTGGKLHFLLGP